MKIKIVKLGSRAVEMEVEEGCTVENATKQAELEIYQQNLSIDGVACGPSSVVREGCVVMLIPKAEGGQL